jgi:hypothetical protein
VFKDNQAMLKQLVDAMDRIVAGEPPAAVAPPPPPPVRREPPPAPWPPPPAQERAQVAGPARVVDLSTSHDDLAEIVRDLESAARRLDHMAGGGPSGEVSQAAGSVSAAFRAGDRNGVREGLARLARGLDVVESQAGGSAGLRGAIKKVFDLATGLAHRAHLIGM